MLVLGTWWEEFMALPGIFSLLTLFIGSWFIILGEVLKRLFRLELLIGAFFLSRLSLTIFDGPPFEEDWEAGFPWLLATDWDLLLGESTLLPFPLPTEWSLLDIYVMLAFFLDWSISVWICFIFVSTFLSLFFEERMFLLRF